MSSMKVNLVSNMTPRSRDSFLKERIWDIMEYEQRILINRLLYPTKKHLKSSEETYYENTDFPLLLGYFEKVHYRRLNLQT